MIQLTSADYRAQVAPERGATILRLDWRHPDLGWMPLFDPLGADGFAGGCFVMAPFANRIMNGRFHFNGRDYAIPINRPESRMAIHGISRNRAWQAQHRSDGEVVLSDMVQPSDHPWHYRATLSVSLVAHAATITLSLRNLGDVALPFGMGVHPWFPRPVGTQLTFSAEGSFAPDERGLPAGALIPARDLGTGRAVDLDFQIGLDTCFRVWAPRTARLVWPASGTAIALRGADAFRHLHVFVLEDRAVCCVEPVTHLPDAINRPGLGTDAAMDVLAPGEELSGSLQISAAAFPRS